MGHGAVRGLASGQTCYAVGKRTLNACPGGPEGHKTVRNTAVGAVATLFLVVWPARLTAVTASRLLLQAGYVAITFMKKAQMAAIHNAGSSGRLYAVRSACEPSRVAASVVSALGRVTGHASQPTFLPA